MTALLDGNFAVLMILLLINFVLCLKKIPNDFPIINIVFSIFTILVSIATLNITSIPLQPYISALVGLIAGVQLLINVLSTKV